MKEKLWLDADIAAMSHSAPIRFAHHKTIDKPENHVLHINNHVEIYFYISGNHRYIVENTLYELQRGDIIVINPREVHRALPLSEGPYERFYFLVDSNAFGGMNLDPLEPILRKPPDIGNLISPDKRTKDAIIDTLYEISACFTEGKNEQLRAFSLFLRILDEINRNIKNAAPSMGSITQMPSLLRQILVYIAENTAELQSTAQISEAIGITPQYLSSYFSKHTGTSLKVYIQAKKIALAKTLLDKGLDVTQTCYDCGFNDCSYFIKIFKKYVGVTPLTYKLERIKNNGYPLSV